MGRVGNKRLGMGLALIAGVMVLSLSLAMESGAETSNHDQQVNSVHRFRDNYVAAWTGYYEVGVLLEDKTGNSVLVNLATEQLANANQMSDEDIALLLEAGADFAPLADALNQLAAVLGEGALDLKGEDQVEYVDSAGFPNADYSSRCGSDRTNTEEAYAALLALNIAKESLNASSRICDEVIVVLGEGGNASLACLPLDIAVGAAEIALNLLSFCDDDIDSAEIEGSYERLAHLHGDLERVEGKIDTLLEEVAKVQRQNCEIIQLLHTPQGRRRSNIDVCEGSRGFPYDWPEKQKKNKKRK